MTEKGFKQIFPLGEKMMRMHNILLDRVTCPC